MAQMEPNNVTSAVACALKAQDMTAQGNALGSKSPCLFSPERAAHFGSAFSGLDIIATRLTQGVALGCQIPGLQPF